MDKQAWSDACQLEFSIPAVVSPDSSIQSQLFYPTLDPCDFLRGVLKLHALRCARNALRGCMGRWSIIEKGKDAEQCWDMQTDMESRPRLVSQLLELPTDMVTEASTPGMFEFMHRETRSKSLCDAETQTEMVPTNAAKCFIFPEVQPGDGFWSDFLQSDIRDKADRLRMFEDALARSSPGHQSWKEANSSHNSKENDACRLETDRKEGKSQALRRLLRANQSRERLDLTLRLREWIWRVRELNEFQKSEYSPSVSFQSIGEEYAVQSPQGYFLPKTLELMSESNRHASLLKMTNISQRLVSKDLRSKHRAWCLWQLYSLRVESRYFRTLLRSIDDVMQSAKAREAKYTSVQLAKQSQMDRQLAQVIHLTERLLAT